MASIKFEEGYRTYDINGDPNRVIKVATTDFAIINRFKDAEANIKAKVKEYEKININPDGTAEADTDEAIAAIGELTRFIEEQINYIFNSDIAGIVFNGQSCLSTYHGVPLYERFINAIIPEIEKDLKSETKASQDRINKYTTNKYKKNVNHQKKGTGKK